MNLPLPLGWTGVLLAALIAFVVGVASLLAWTWLARRAGWSEAQAIGWACVTAVVIGAGIYGAAITREAALRGLDVRLVERDDFGGATSSNSHHIIHGGVRYLQHGDVARVLESIRERHSLSRIAPHLVRPQPVVIPTYGHGLRGRELLLFPGSALPRGAEASASSRAGATRVAAEMDPPPLPDAVVCVVDASARKSNCTVLLSPGASSIV